MTELKREFSINYSQANYLEAILAFEKCLEGRVDFSLNEFEQAGIACSHLKNCGETLERFQEAATLVSVYAKTLDTRIAKAKSMLAGKGTKSQSKQVAMDLMAPTEPHHQQELVDNNFVE